MLSNDDHSGIFYFLVGMVVLVLTAVGLSIVVEKRVSFSSGVGQVQRDLAASSAELSELKEQLEHRSHELKELESKSQSQAAGFQKVRTDLAKSGERKMELLARKDKLATALPALDAAFSACRSDYRAVTWRKAIGESYPRLAIRGGREYRDVAITKVTEVGIEIRHEHGIARIQAPDLDSAWQERFQWDDEERRAKLKEEDLSLQSQSPSTETHSQVDLPKESELASIPSTLTDADSPEKAANLTSLRTQVLGWRSKVNLLSSERSIAASNASRGYQTSVPGTLETWGAKSTRLGTELVHAQVEYAKAKARLAAISPSDSLLRTSFDGNR